MSTTLHSTLRFKLLTLKKKKYIYIYIYIKSLKQFIYEKVLLLKKESIKLYHPNDK